MKTITALTIDSLTFDDSNFILQEITGLELPTVRLPRYNLPGNSGAFISNALYGERAIRIKGVVNAPDGQRTTFLTNRTTLINALAYKIDSNNNIIPQTMSLSLVNGQNLTVKVYVDTPLQMGFSSDQVDYQEFQIGLIAPDPYLNSSSPISGIVTLPIGGGTAIPTPVPVSLGASSGGSLNLINIGSQISYPIITLYGPLTNAYITNQTTGTYISLNYVIGPSDLPVVINCQNQTIYQGSNNITGVQTPNSTFWYLLSGSNSFGFSSSGGTGYMSISFYPTFLGV